MTPFSDWDSSRLDLAAEALTVGADPDELRQLRSGTAQADWEELEYVITAVNLAGLGELEAPPTSLMDRLAASASDTAPVPTPQSTSPNNGRDVAQPTDPPARGPGALVALSGWLAAAAVALLYLAPVQDGQDGSGQPTRDELLAQADLSADVVRWDWSLTEDELADGVSGDIVWSVDDQQGYMHFHGLAPNDPTEAQYQLWMFDPSRADWEAQPVDGGVFDVTSEGDVIVPIHAKLAVDQPALFAVTLEKPGGVVVSKRERLVLTAAPGE